MAARLWRGAKKGLGNTRDEIEELPTAAIGSTVRLISLCLDTHWVVPLFTKLISKSSHWPLHAAKALKSKTVSWPLQYERANIFSWLRATSHKQSDCHFAWQPSMNAALACAARASTTTVAQRVYQLALTVITLLFATEGLAHPAGGDAIYSTIITPRSGVISHAFAVTKSKRRISPRCSLRLGHAA